MEEVVEEKQTFRDKISKYLPLIIFAIIALVIGLSMIGNFYRVKIDGEKVFVIFLDELKFRTQIITRRTQ